ncbi:MAG TPA: type III pantothenate kinase, partial [Pyrinomonadaceae bacterium]|nr:type III pantothenate kinase [Pyrinomonadaceae bacterium]
FVKNDDDFGLKINYCPLDAVGTDRLINAFAATEKYGAPSIVCSFGTATTFDVVGKGRELLGGTIAPGMKTMLKALHLHAARLPHVELAKPANLLGNTTAAAIQSGVFYGHIAMVEGMIRRSKRELAEKALVIATGGFAPMTAANTDKIDIVDENLTLDGLRFMHQRIGKTAVTDSPRHSG